MEAPADRAEAAQGKAWKSSSYTHQRSVDIVTDGEEAVWKRNKGE